MSFKFSAKIGNNFITCNTFCFFKAIKQKSGRTCVRFRGFVEFRLYKVTKQRLFACVFHLTADVTFTR